MIRFWNQPLTRIVHIVRQLRIRVQSALGRIAGWHRNEDLNVLLLLSDLTDWFAIDRLTEHFFDVRPST